MYYNDTQPHQDKAANACWKYKDGVSNLQWYLPGMGELGYIMPRFNLINASLTAVGGVAVDGSYYFWSSTENYSSDACVLYTGDGNVYGNNKGSFNSVRPFCSL